MFILRAPARPMLHPLSLHDALPIYREGSWRREDHAADGRHGARHGQPQVDLFVVNVGIFPPRPAGQVIAVVGPGDRKSTRLNSSHTVISYAVFCLKKKTSKCESSQI